MCSKPLAVADVFPRVRRRICRRARQHSSSSGGESDLDTPLDPLQVRYEEVGRSCCFLTAVRTVFHRWEFVVRV